MGFRPIKRVLDTHPEDDHDKVDETSATPNVEKLSDYAVGYGKPPAHTRFKPGVSGNPKGRKKASKGIRTIVREAMLQKVTVRTAQGEKRLTRAEATFAKMLEKAFAGDAKALDLVLRMYADAVPDEAAVDDSASTETGASDEAVIRAFMQITKDTLANDDDEGEAK